MSSLPTQLSVTCPDWVREVVGADKGYLSSEAMMGVAIRLARENVVRGSGGPFGAAVFEADSGRLLAVGVNCVVGSQNSVLHAEILALMLAEKRVGSHTLSCVAGGCVLATSCEPCAMCLGAILWSGVSRLVCGATRGDAQRIGFDEGPVFDASYAYLEERGIAVARGVLREDARSVLESYAANAGAIYNP